MDILSSTQLCNEHPQFSLISLSVNSIGSPNGIDFYCIMDNKNQKYLALIMLVAS